MKIKLLLALALISVATVFNSCKKYEEGPMLSLKTKNARITGEWELTEMKEVYTYNYKTSYGNESGSDITTYSNGILSNDGESITYSLVYNIEKNGILETTEIEDGERYSLKSYWSWLDGEKGKEFILLEDMYQIIKLTNKELILEINSSSDSENKTSSTKATYTFEKK